MALGRRWVGENVILTSRLTTRHLRERRPIMIHRPACFATGKNWTKTNIWNSGPLFSSQGISQRMSFSHVMLCIFSQVQIYRVLYFIKAYIILYHFALESRSLGPVIISFFNSIWLRPLRPQPTQARHSCTLPVTLAAAEQRISRICPSDSPRGKLARARPKLLVFVVARGKCYFDISVDYNNYSWYFSW